jgi:methyl-accepting chemotaxis protein
MSIGRKVMIALCMTSAIVVICIMIPLLTSQELKILRGQFASYEKIQSEAVLAQELQLQVANVWQFFTDASLTRDKEVIDKEAKPAYDSSLRILSELKALSKDDAAQTANLVKTEQAISGMWQVGMRMFEGYGKSSVDGNAVMKEYDTTCDVAIRDASAVSVKARGDGLLQMKEVDGHLDALTGRLFGTGGVAATIGIFVVVMMFLIRRSIVRSLAAMIEEIGCLAHGDLSREFDARGSDELAQVSAMLNQFIKKLHLAVSNISSTSSRLSSAAIGFHTTSDRIATGAEEVAMQAGTVATASEEMSATSSVIAQNCVMAAEGAQRASQAASDGARVVEKTVEVMGQIADKVQESARTVEGLGARSDQIGDIISTIEDIADQTNLLALNAAIEAARAGEQGRGFAVVADEVRALAERTTGATKEIGAMIKAIQEETKTAVVAMEMGVEQVENGKQEAARSGEAIRDILDYINAASTQVNTIAVAAKEQTATTSEISDNIHKITTLVQQTSQDAQESAAATGELNRSSKELEGLVQQFML